MVFFIPEQIKTEKSFGHIVCSLDDKYHLWLREYFLTTAEEIVPKIAKVALEYFNKIVTNIVCGC